MQLDLVHHGKDLGGVHERLQMMGLEVAHADGAHPPVQVERLQRAPGFLVRALPRVLGALGRRPVDEIEVDVVEMELLAGFLERLQRAVVAAVGVPHLRGDEQLFARHAAGGQRLAHRRLVVVGRRRVDVAVAVGKGLVDRIDAHLAVGHLVRAEADAGNLVAVSQHDGVARALQVCHCMPPIPPPRRAGGPQSFALATIPARSRSGQGGLPFVARS